MFFFLIPVGVYCVAGKMFLNVLTHGGNAKFTGSMYIKEKQGVSECTFTAATDAQVTLLYNLKKKVI